MVLITLLCMARSGGGWGGWMCRRLFRSGRYSQRPVHTGLEGKKTVLIVMLKGLAIYNNILSENGLGSLSVCFSTKAYNS